MEIAEDYPTLSEIIIDYFGLVNEYESEKLYILVNYKSYTSELECEKFFDEILKSKHNVILIETTSRNKLKNENLYIVDSDLREIC